MNTTFNLPRRERVEHDWYVEPVSVTERLLTVERPFIGRLLDPCCGQGNVVQAVERKMAPVMVGRPVISGGDIVQRGPGFMLGDFRDTVPGLSETAWDSVISNPPYNAAQEVAELAFQHTRDRVCLFLRLAFLEGRKRSAWLRESSLARVWVLPDRVSCTPGHLLGREQKRFSGSVAYAWFVWERGHKGRPEVDWLPMMEGE